MIEPDENIPASVVEYWKKLRFHFEREVLNLVKEERERTKEQPDFNTLGIYAVAGAKLLERLDKLMQNSTDIAPPSQRRLPSLKSNSPDKQ